MQQLRTTYELAEHCRMMVSLALKIGTHETELDLPQARDTRINDLAPITRVAAEASVGVLRIYRTKYPKAKDPFSLHAPRLWPSPTERKFAAPLTRAWARQGHR
ncbi:hypothetical protein NKH84_14430 [Mesorhizobium sp. M0902]|uniref:hypothetical protein n=1 Tax=Mesorhizobium sp. M0902 TaxID=2957021 RepID=UPI00333C8B20